MVSSKTKSNKSYLILTLALGLFLCGSTAAVDLEWINFTSLKEVRRVATINDTLFMATSGGILAVTDPVLPGRHYTNLDGLGTNDITDIIRAADGQKWATGFGRLIQFDGSNSTQFSFFDGDGNLFRLNRVMDDGDNLWIGSDLGLVLFSTTNDGGQIQDSYQLFGDLNPSPIVNDILLKADSIWLATSSGLAVAVRTVPSLLKAPSNWAVFGLNKYPILATDTIQNVVAFEESIYVGTSRAVFRLEIDTATSDTSFVEIPFGNNVSHTRLRVENDTLLIYFNDNNGGGIGSLVGNELTMRFISGLPSAPVTGGSTVGRRWVGVRTGGVYYEEGDGTWAEYPYTGLPGNDITDISVTRDGQVTAAFRTLAVARLEDSAWIPYEFPVIQGTSVLMTDSLNRRWMGTIGNGLWLDDGDELVNFDETNTPMIGNIDNLPSSASFVIITGLATDGDYIYAACYRALNRFPIVFGYLNNITNPLGWDSIGVDNGIGDNRVVSLDLYGGNLAVGTESDGVYVCNVGDNPLNRDIECIHYTRENLSFLISNSVRTVRFSPGGILWVGTNFGLSRFDPGIDRFVDVNLPASITSDVSAMEFDTRGNLWVGTREGLVRVDATTGEFKVFNTLNSALVSNGINSITFDPFTGDCYIATTGGFSMVPSMTGRPAFEIDEVIAFPNPFVISGDGDLLNFNFAHPGTVKIFNVAGEPVKEMPVNARWDGRNEQGSEVASGVYIFVITDDDGEAGRGKFLLIRQ